MLSPKHILFSSALLLAPIAFAAEETVVKEVTAGKEAARANVRDLGTHGPLYDIAEPDAMQTLQARLESLKKSGELAKLEEEWKKQVVRRAEEPVPVAGLTRTQKPRTFLWDPTVVATQDIRDTAGNVIIPAGTRVNPFGFTNLSKHLFLFDARDKAQAEYAKKVLATYGEDGVKLILTGGSYLEFMRTHKVRVYYDQNGGIVRRLGIQQVPAIVSQEGDKLRVSELQP